ncbi:spindle pole body protein Kms2 [Schizosaccharomyces japonicus yFS275]|uniref:Spindle pole body protein Kms2 n=1 Tax=Schizosaccharomyces japonicus (strain yFS275 / FY16936) TaxID=402676 RepID=B6K753_SCHJY|nr:spindle pole body protein Kms2 [Schizosaccharomyces japonicus yFS275]EEB09357.1 spindle pole body protein Kms2 [Schizosaccharomyces japonicus yFS275]
MSQYVPFDRIVDKYEIAGTGKVSIRDFLSIIDEVGALQVDTAPILLDDDQRESAKIFIRNNSDFTVTRDELKSLFFELTGQKPDSIRMQSSRRIRDDKSMKNGLKRREKNDFMLFADGLPSAPYQNTNNIGYLTPRAASPVNPVGHSTPLTLQKPGNSVRLDDTAPMDQDSPVIESLVERIQSQEELLRKKDAEILNNRRQMEHLLEELDTTEAEYKNCLSQAKLWEKKCRESMQESHNLANQLHTVHVEYEEQASKLERLEGILQDFEKERKFELEKLSQQEDLDGSQEKLIRENHSMRTNLTKLQLECDRLSRLLKSKTATDGVRPRGLTPRFTQTSIQECLDITGVPSIGSIPQEQQLVSNLGLLVKELNDQRLIIEKLRRLRHSNSNAHKKSSWLFSSLQSMIPFGKHSYKHYIFLSFFLIVGLYILCLFIFKIGLFYNWSVLDPFQPKDTYVWPPS